jgi:hypothetical protein
VSDIKLTFKVLFLVGTLVLLLGFILVSVPQSDISGLKAQLSQTTLNSEKASLERMISAESMNLNNFYLPMSDILKVFGGLVLVYSILSTAFEIALENRSKKQ